MSQQHHGFRNVTRDGPAPGARPELARGGEERAKGPRASQPSQARAEPPHEALVRGLVGLDDAGRDAAAVTHGVTVLAGPVANGAGLLAVHAATGRTGASATGSAVATADL